MGETSLIAELKPKRGRPRLSIEEKIRNGTYRPGRERARLLAEQAVKPAPVFIEIEPDPEARQDYVAVIHAYMAGVRSGEIIAGKWVKLAVERQYRDEAKWSAAALAGSED